jgi:ribonuclease T2
MVTYWSSYRDGIPRSNGDLWTHEWTKHGKTRKEEKKRDDRTHEKKKKNESFPIFFYFFIVGTCLSTLEPKCYSNYQQYQDVYDYFSTALQLRQKWDLYSILSSADIVPGFTYSFDDFESAIETAVGFKPRITCSGGSDLNEVWIFFHVQNGNEYIPTDSIRNSTCGGSIHYPTK